METMTVNDVSVAIYSPKPETKGNTLRRAMLQMPVVMQSLNSIEKAIFIATTDKTFEEYTDTELVAELSGSLRWIAKDIGIRDTESPDWKASIIRICQISKRYYSNFSIKDIKMAFELLITGELNDYLPKDRYGNPDKEHYQSFNADYFCKIINAYRLRRYAVIEKAIRVIPQPEKKRNPDEDAYYRNCTRRSTIRAFVEYKYRGRMPKLSPVMEMLAYELLSNCGLAEPYVITRAEQKAILEQTIAEFERNYQFFEAAQVRKAGTNAEELKCNYNRKARKKALKAAFDYMIENELQITDYIKYETISNKLV